jgi:hypothetical protein
MHLLYTNINKNDAIVNILECFVRNWKRQFVRLFLFKQFTKMSDKFENGSADDLYTHIDNGSKVQGVMIELFLLLLLLFSLLFL